MVVNVCGWARLELPQRDCPERWARAPLCSVLALRAAARACSPEMKSILCVYVLQRRVESLGSSTEHEGCGDAGVFGRSRSPVGAQRCWGRFLLGTASWAMGTVLDGLWCSRSGTELMGVLCGRGRTGRPREQEGRAPGDRQGTGWTGRLGPGLLSGCLVLNAAKRGSWAQAGAGCSVGA